MELLVIQSRIYQLGIPPEFAVRRNIEPRLRDYKTIRTSLVGSRL